MSLNRGEQRQVGKGKTMQGTFSREMQPKLTALERVLDALGVEPEIETVDDRKRVQKAIYLGQRAGVDLGYRYGWYKKGPYSPRLTRDYYALAEALDIGESAGTAKLKPSEATKLRRIRPLFAVPAGVALSPEDWLELVASVDYLKRVSKVSDADAKKVIRDQKPTLFRFLPKARAALRQYGLA
jgi:uncharacterized protein YwgA